MTRKITKTAPPAKARRTRSMEKCIEDAQDYLRPRGKKINKTRTMARTIEEGKKILAPKIHAPIKTVAKAKPAARPARPAVPSAPARSIPPPVPVAIPASTSKITKTNTHTKAVVPSKATIFKTSSKDLPLPAFGFIDICFCLDATGSMSSELAQVQSIINSLIEKIQNKVRTEGITLRFAVVAYRDHGDPNIIEAQDFTDAHDTIPFVNKLVASGGGD